MIYIENTGGILIECPVVVPDGGTAPGVPLYRVRTYDGAKVIHDYKPCRNPQGTEGMFDLIDRTFTEKNEFLEMLDDFVRNRDSISITVGG